MSDVDLLPRNVEDLPNEFEPRLWRLEHKPKNIYLAASLAGRESASIVALNLQDLGFRVTSRWLRHDFSDKPDKRNFREFAKYEQKWGLVDVEDMHAADTLVLLADVQSSSGGYHFELGYFIGTGRSNVVVVGDRPNVFFFLPDVRYCPNTSMLLEWIVAPEHGKTSWPPPPAL